MDDVAKNPRSAAAGDGSADRQNWNSAHFAAISRPHPSRHVNSPTLANPSDRVNSGPTLRSEDERTMSDGRACRPAPLGLLAALGADAAAVAGQVGALAAAPAAGFPAGRTARSAPGSTRTSTARPNARTVMTPTHETANRTTAHTAISHKVRSARGMDPIVIAPAPVPLCRKAPRGVPTPGAYCSEILSLRSIHNVAWIFSTCLKQPHARSEELARALGRSARPLQPGLGASAAAARAVEDRKPAAAVRGRRHFEGRHDLPTPAARGGRSGPLLGPTPESAAPAKKPRE